MLCGPRLLSLFINLTQVHNFTVSAQDILTFPRLSVFTVSFYENFASTNADNETFCTVLLTSQVVWYRVYNQKVLSSSPRIFFLYFYLFICFN